MSRDIFVSEGRPRGDLAGVFEYDGDVGWFYLFKNAEGGGDGSILDAVHVMDDTAGVRERDFSIRWSNDEERVLLFHKDRICAAFDVRSKKKWGMSAGGQCDIAL